MDFFKNIVLHWDIILSETFGAFISGAILLGITLYIQNKNFKKQIELDELKSFQQTDLFKTYLKSMNTNSWDLFFNLELINYKIAEQKINDKYNYSYLFFQKYHKYYKWFYFEGMRTKIFSPCIHPYCFTYTPHSSSNRHIESEDMYIIINTFLLNTIRDEQTELLNSLLDDIDNNMSLFSSKKIHSYLTLFKTLIKPETPYYPQDNMGNSNFYKFIKDFEEKNIPLIVDYFCKDLTNFNKEFHGDILCNLYRPVCIKITNIEEYGLFLKSFDFHILSEKKSIQNNIYQFNKKRMIHNLKYENSSFKNKILKLYKLFNFHSNKCVKHWNCNFCRFKKNK